MSQSVKQQTVNSAKWVFLDKGANQGVSFLFSILMARILMPDDFGVLAIITVVVNITAIFVDSGFSSALIRKPNLVERDLSTVFYFNVLIALVCYLIVFAISPFLASFFKMPILTNALRVQALSLIIQSFAAVQIAVLTIRLDFKSLAIRSVIASIISCVIALGMAYMGLGIWALVAQTLLYSLINMLLISFYSKWRPKTGFSKASFIELGGYGSKLLLSSLIQTIYQELSSILIGRFYTAKELGYYKRGSDFAGIPSGAINGVISKVTFPILAKIQDDKERLINVYRKYIQSVSLVMFIFCVTLAALAKPLILVVLGEKWSEAIIYLQIFSLSCMFNHISSINLNLLKVIGRSDLYLRLEIIKKIISIIMLICAVQISVLAICISMFIYNQISIIINTYYTGKLFNMGYWVQVRDFSKYLIVSLVSALPGFFLTFLPINNIIILLVGPIVIFSLYVFVLRNDVLMIETIAMLKDQLKRILKR